MQRVDNRAGRMRIAAIDVGSNSIHMVVAQVESDGRFRVLDSAKERVRLGARTLATGQLSEEAIDAGLRTIAAFKTLAERHGAHRIQAVATSAVREAANGGEFVQLVKDQIGLRLKVIPGREEARLIYLGVAHAVDLRQQPSLILDAGGGSVELIRVENGQAAALYSVKLGVTRLAEKFISNDPPSSKELKALEDHIQDSLAPVLAACAEHKIERLIGTSGTMLSLVAMAAETRGENLDGHLNLVTASADEIAKIRRQVQKSDRDERLKIPGMEAKRVDIVIPGAALADTVLSALGIKEMTACTWALREGVLLDFIARHPRRIAETTGFPDPRLRSIARLLRHCNDDSGEHGSHVGRLAGQMFDQLKGELELPEEAGELLKYAALLHDIGHHIGHQDHQRHAYYMITNSELLGFRRDEIELVALIARYHQKAPPKDSDEGYAELPKPQKRLVRALAAILRVADGLDRSHYGIVRDVTLNRRGDRLIVRAHTAGDDAGLELWEASRRASLLEDVLGSKVEIQLAETVRHADRTASVSR